MKITFVTLISIAFIVLYKLHTVHAIVCEKGTYHNVSNIEQCVQCGEGTYNDVHDSYYVIQFTSGEVYRWVYNFLTQNNEPLYRRDFGYPIRWEGVRMHSTQRWRTDTNMENNYGLFTGWDIYTGNREGFSKAMTNSNFCFFCNRGYYQPSTGKTSCLLCPLNTTTDGLSPAPQCSPCTKPNKCCRPTTYLKNPQDTFCTDCPIGTYNFDVDATICTNCSAGYSTAKNGSLWSGECVACAAGTFSLPGSMCIDCPPGTVSETTGSSTCKPCAPGSHTNISKATACQVCPPGTFSNTTGSPTCIPCNPGTFSNLSNSTVCLTCPAQMHSPQKATYCRPCTEFRLAKCDVVCPANFTRINNKCQNLNNGSFTFSFKVSLTNPSIITEEWLDKSEQAVALAMGVSRDQVYSTFDPLPTTNTNRRLLNAQGSGSAVSVTFIILALPSQNYTNLANQVMTPQFQTNLNIAATQLGIEALPVQVETLQGLNFAVYIPIAPGPPSASPIGAPSPYTPDLRSTAPKMAYARLMLCISCIITMLCLFEI